jgi:Arc/MetJ-type ribon-helix-helix transcriptional regulator
VEYLDKLAEASVKEAIQSLVAAGKRPNSQSVPKEARRLLLPKGRGRVSQADAEKRVQQAIERMRERKEIKAPRAPYNDWALIGASAPKPPAESA